jgi:hypothetical protein
VGSVNKNHRAHTGDYFIWFDLSFTNNTSKTHSVSGSDLYLCLQSDHDQYWAMADFINQGPFSVKPGYYLKDVQFAWVVPCSATKFRLTYFPDSHTNLNWYESTKGCSSL